MLPAETVIIAGPTGVGKTTLGLRLAKRLGGEIVGADAFQLYRGLPILTAQPTPAQQAGVPHHLLGSVDPAEGYDAGRYAREAPPIIEAIAARGRIPIVIGGTGLYLKALIFGLDELPGNDPALRKELSGIDLPSLLERLRMADPDALALIDTANRRRVERALEIVVLTGRPLAESRTGRMASARLPGVRSLLLTREREELSARIGRNVRMMFERGVEREVAALPEEKTGPTAAMALGLREIRALLHGELSRGEAEESITTATRRYAKRQKTWFRNQHAFPSLDLSRFASEERALEEALRLLAGN